ncbi:cation:proton antiporter [Catenuloplanes atrovinosus]|uniref:Kef-type K+ transport system membrane component KefB n=1 Tax=Catenuloplanes atrovinosus TaxID=137266 RepID=A0AAE4CA03_9ACTN|nr:cation:proton antiporter [Catenuloplanes atrovinosus]MDR7277106.1 Kef-type K+ transport system membrane component KefB [Catenuloplanes atrovinosus]
MSPVELAPRFFIAVAAILLVCRLVAWLLGKVGQPAVVSEMLAGVLLGPSLLGLLLPGVQAALFPRELYPILYVVGQVGLVIFMFQAGYAFRSHRIHGLFGTAGAVSAAGVVVPLALGVLLVLGTGDRVPVLKPGVPIGVSAAFVGVALAITAFPMMARIITEKGHAGTRHGAVSLAAGAIDDAVAWILLACVLAVASGAIVPALTTIGGAVIFAVLIWYVVRPLSARLMGSDRMSDATRLLGTVALLFLIAWYTDEIGLYAVFGAFAVGAVMPRMARTESVVNTLNPICQIVFLPLFFTFSGLRTEFALLSDPAVLLFALVCVALAVAGKFGGCWAAARMRGETQPVALRVGALMNARGLMQLIALNVGLEAGIVGPAMFTALVLVALVTTLMTTPVLSWLERREASRIPVSPAAVVGSH